jgi:hypothetical protein
MNTIFWSGLPNKNHLPQRYIGPYQLGHWLEQHGYTYQVIDFIQQGEQAHISTERLVELTEKFITKDTLTIGFSSTFFIYGRGVPVFILDAMLIIRARYPDIKFVLGGNMAENITADITERFDAVIIGLAEDVMLELLNWYSGKGAEPRRRIIPSTRAKYYYGDDATKQFDIQTNAHKWADKDCILPAEVLPIEISRGCIFKCRFCQYPLLGRSKHDYTRSMDCVRDELVNNYERFGVTNYYLLDDTFNDTVVKVEAFANMIANLPFRMSWVSYIRADLLHRFPDTIAMVKEAGLKGAFFGIESFGKEAALAVGKGFSASHAQEFLPKLIHEHWDDEIAVHISMIAGLPGDTKESLNATVDWFYANRIYSWDFKPLWILQHQGQKIFSSVFSREAPAYGYMWPDSQAPANWVNPKTGWTYNLAEQAADQLNSRKSELHQNDIWLDMSLNTIGIPNAHLKPSRAINKTIAANNIRQWYEDYFCRLQAL